MLGAPATSAISILHSLGILSLMAIGISMLQPSRLNDGPGWWRSLVMGGVFGATTAVVMVDPMVFPPGATIDPRGGPAMLAGVYGGPLAAAVAAAIGSVMRWSIGGAGAPGGIAGLAVYALVGTLAWRSLRHRRARPTLAWFLGLAVIGTLCALPSVFLLPDWRSALQLIANAWWMVFAGNIIGVLVLGFLLEQDWRRRSLENDLRVTEARTRAAADAKTRFLASMSHEMRTPMNAVVGFVDLLMDSRLDGFQRRCGEQIREAAQGLLRVIDDMLDFAKIDAGSVSLDPQPVDVAGLVAACRELLLPQITSKGLTCIVRAEDGLPPTVEADPVRLRQVLLNLLGNAVKFTDSGRITVTLSYRPGPADARGELLISITDTGIGLTEDERQRLFSPFAQGDHVGRGGTGLGLVISHTLVHAMGGDLGLHSVPGDGTTVTISLPVREVPAEPPPENALPEPAVAPALSLRVLVAEDVALNAEMLQATLEQAGHAVHLVVNGRQALEAARTGGFDVILMDVQMPEMDGLAATRAIRALEGAAGEVPIIALTAYASREDLRTCLDAGMNDFLTKPLERVKLHAILDRWGGARAGGAASGELQAGGQPPPRPQDGGGAADEGLLRVGSLLARLAEAHRDDRAALQALAHNLAAAAGAAGLDKLAERARRLVAASPRSNPDALGALIEDAAETGRRSLAEAAAQGRGQSR